MKPLLLRTGVLLLVLAAIGIAFQTANDAYLTLANAKGMLRAMAVSGVVAIGLTFVIVVRKFDLSLPGVASLAAMTLGFTLAETNALVPTILACVGVGLACGAVNGLLIGRFGLPDVVTTIAVGSVAYGLAFVYNNGATYSQNFFSSGMVNINFKTVLGMQIPVFVLVAVSAAAFVILHLMRFGSAFYAVGENPVAARFSGISLPGVMVAAFGICGATVGVSMLLHVAAAGSSFVTAGGQILLPAYTAVYLGAALFGRPSVPATLAGALLMTMLLNGFTLLSVPYYYSDIVVSTVLIVAIVAFDPKVARLLRRPGASRPQRA